jgi:hypothetical protein
VAMLMHLPIVFGSLVLIPAAPPEIGVTFDLVFAAELWLLVAAVVIRGSLGGVVTNSSRWRRNCGDNASPLL